MNIRKNIILRVYAAFFMLAIVAVAIVARVVQIQTVEGDKWKRMSDSLSTNIVNVEAVRGNIYSFDGSLLATSLPEYELRFDLMTETLTNEIFDAQVDSLAFYLSMMFKDKTANEYERKLISARHSKDRYLLLKRTVTYLQLKKIKTFPIFRMGKNKGGLLVIQKNKRIQPFKTLASRTIGYKVNGVQPVGLEGAFDKELGGESGKRLMQRIGAGIWMPMNEEDAVASKNGLDIITTIDVNIQDVAQKALNQQLIKHNADHGCVVLMEVATGEIKAIANLTRIEPGVYQEKYNYAVGEATEPGSTFKLASYIAALEDGVFDLDDTVDTEGGKKRYFNHTLRDSHEGGYGKIPMRKAFELSSNVAISKMIYNGYKDRPEQFITRMRELGLNEQLDLQIPGAPKPRLKDTKSRDWSGLSLPLLSIGYEIRMTPLQTLTLYNAVANNGKMVSPHFVKEMRDAGQIVKVFEPKIIRKKICSDKTISKVKEMMEGVVREGTAKNLSTTVYTIAGKTGTAQVAQGDQGYKNGKRTYLASFCGYFPAENPKYSIIVVVTDPSSSGYYGNVVAGPIFKEIADKVYATSLTMHKDVSEEYASYPITIPVAKTGLMDKTKIVYSKIGIKTPTIADTEWVNVELKNNNISMSSKQSIVGIMPSVIGMGLEDAVYLLENAGLKALVKGSGKVFSQSISMGNKIAKGAQIVINLK